jgi:hypothetical protein
MNQEELKSALQSPVALSIPADGHTILERARVRDRIVRGAVGGATLLSILLISGFALWQRPAPDLTPRGAGDVAPTLELGWLVEGETATRGTGAPITSDQKVIFRAKTSVPGFLCLDERDADGAWQRLFPFAGEAWTVDAGEHLLESDGAAQTFRTDLGSGARDYRLTLDLDDAACAAPTATAQIELEWMP